MTQYNGNYTDENGRAVKGAFVYVYTSEGVTADIDDTNDNPISQPLITDENGNFSYRAPDAYYIHNVWVGKRRVLIENEVIIGTSYRDQAQSAAQAALAAAGVGQYANTAAGLAATVQGKTFSVNNGNGTGTIYRHDPGPVATAIGKFIIDPTGAGSAALIGKAGGGSVQDHINALVSSAGGDLVGWIRAAVGAVTRSLTSKFFGYVDVEDFGAVGNGVTDDTLAWTRAITFVKTRGLKLRAMSTSYLVSRLIFDGAGYEVATTAGNLFKQKSGLTGDGNVHPIWDITGSRITFGDASFEGNIATDVDEYSHAVMMTCVKDIRTGVLHGKNIRGDVVYVYGRISSEAEMSRGVDIAGITGDNILRCILAVSGGEGSTGYVRRVGSMRVGYKDVDWEPNLVSGTTNDYQAINWKIGHIYGATVQCVSADPDVQNGTITNTGRWELDGGRILNSTPAYSGHPGANDFAISINDCLSFNMGDVNVTNFPYSPIKIGDKVGSVTYGAIRFGAVAVTDGTYKSVVLHLGSDAPAVVKGGWVKGVHSSNNRYVFRGAAVTLNLDVGQVDVTGGLFGSQLTGKVAGIKLDCGGAAGEIAFGSLKNMEIGKTVITNAAAAYGFYDCDNLVLRDWSGAFGAGLEYLALSANIVTINSTLNGATGDGINILSGGKVRINGLVVADAQGAAIADAAASVAAPTKAEFDALVGKFNAVLAQRRLGVTRQA